MNLGGISVNKRYNPCPQPNIKKKLKQGIRFQMELNIYYQSRKVASMEGNFGFRFPSLLTQPASSSHPQPQEDQGQRLSRGLVHLFVRERLDLNFSKYFYMLMPTSRETTERR
jgi:hypothetical protein